MDKEEFLKLNIEDRVKYFNEKIKEVGSYNKVCKELNISTCQSGILKKHGWIRSGDKFIYDKNLDKNNNINIDRKVIEHSIPVQKTLFDTSEDLKGYQGNEKNTGEIEKYTNMEREDNKISDKVKRHMYPTNNKNDGLQRIWPDNRQLMEVEANVLTNNIDKSVNQQKVTPKLEISKEEELSYDTNKNGIKPVNDDIYDSDNATKKLGRPSKPGRKKYSLNLNIADFKQLQIYCILNDISPSDVVNNLIKDFLKTVNQQK